TASTTPDLSRFMLLPMNACGFERYSATSIWSSDTPERCVRVAMRESVSPWRTRYSSPLSGPAWVAGADAASRGAVATARGSDFAAGAALGARAGAALECDSRGRQHRVVVDARGLVRIGRRDLDLQVRRLFRRQARHVDFGAQRFAERRLDLQPPEAQRPRALSGQT